MAAVEIPVECSICLENIISVGTNTMLQLGCLHCFHRDCIDEWSRRATPGTCPLCRAEFSVPDVEIPVQCSICLENIASVDTNTMVQLGCLHCFHRDCIDEWFRRAPRRTCPLCRAEFPVPAGVPAGIALLSFIVGGLLLVAGYVTLF